VLRGARLNEQLLAFSRKQHLAPRSVDVRALVDSLSEMLQRTLGGTVDVTQVLAGDLWPTLVDPTQLELVLLNLAINARDALPLGGTVRISARNVKASEVPNALGLAPGDYVCVAVADSGIGMSEAVLARACEPFFTTKELGKGSGLGLSQVYGVARQSGGAIAIDSAPGEGTTVEVYLPRSPTAAETAPLRVAAVAERPQQRRVTILVVDDQPEVREVAVAHLEALGYAVMAAADGKSALHLLGNGSAIDLLIADYAMAEMTGTELARAVRRQRPDLPIVIMTGYLDVSGIDAQISDAALLKKPYHLNELSAAVEVALRRGMRPLASGRRNVVELRRGDRVAREAD